MSSVLFATDLHGNRESYERLFGMEADAIIIGGDLLALQRDLVNDYLAAKRDTRPCYWIPGNDDWEAAVHLLKTRGTPLSQETQG